MPKGMTPQPAASQEPPVLGNAADAAAGRAPSLTALAATAIFAAIGLARAVQGFGPASHFDSAALIGPRHVWLSVFRGELLPALAILAATAFLVAQSDSRRLKAFSVRRQRFVVVAAVVPVMLAAGVGCVLAVASAVGALAYDVSVRAFIENTPASVADVALITLRGLLGGLAVAAGWAWVGRRHWRRLQPSGRAFAFDAAGVCAASIVLENLLSFASVKLLFLFGW